jgi:hypothetical protein
MFNFDRKDEDECDRLILDPSSGEPVSQDRQ